MEEHKTGTQFDQDDQGSIGKDPPPAYESLDIDEDNNTPLRQRINAFFSAHHNEKVPPSWRAKRNVTVLLPDPTHIKCRCGSHRDTTQSQWGLPSGSVSCICGYIVYSSGYSCHPSQAKTTPGYDDGKRCGACARPLKLNHNAGPCSCGAVFHPDGSVQRYCPEHRLWTKDARNVRCKCGCYVDTTATWDIHHQWPKNYARHNEARYSYCSQGNTGRCVCGMTVRRDGQRILEHGNDCCRISSKGAREQSSGSSTECTCAYY